MGKLIVPHYLQEWMKSSIINNINSIIILSKQTLNMMSNKFNNQE